MKSLVLPQFETIDALHWGCQQNAWIQNVNVGGWDCKQTMKGHFKDLEKTF